MENVGEGGEGEKESDLAIQFNLEAAVPPRDFRGSKTSGCIPGVSYPCNLLKRKLTIIIYYSHLGFKINILKARFH